MTSTHNSQNNSTFKHNQLIWAQLSSVTWWPAQILSQTSPSENLYHVDFFIEPSSQRILPPHKIIHYEQFDQELITSRMSPSLKRAIQEINELYSVLEQSKNVMKEKVEENHENMGELGATNEEKMFFLENQTENSSRKSSGNEEEEMKSEKVQHQFKKRKNRTKAFLQSNAENIEQILQSYNLHRIPMPFDELKESQHYGLIVKKLYKMFRKQRKGKESRKLAMEVGKQIMRRGEWRELVREYRKGSKFQQFMNKYVNSQNESLLQ